MGGQIGNPKQRPEDQNTGFRSMQLTGVFGGSSLQSIIQQLMQQFTNPAGQTNSQGIATPGQSMPIGIEPANPASTSPLAVTPDSMRPSSASPLRASVAVSPVMQAIISALSGGDFSMAAGPSGGPSGPAGPSVSPNFSADKDGTPDEGSPFAV